MDNNLVAPIGIMPCRSCIALRLKMIRSSNWERNSTNTKNLRYLRLSYRPFFKYLQIRQPYAAAPPQCHICCRASNGSLPRKLGSQMSQIWKVSGGFPFLTDKNKFAVVVLDQVASAASTRQFMQKGSKPSLGGQHGHPLIHFGSPFYRNRRLTARVPPKVQILSWPNWQWTSTYINHQD